MFYGNILYNLCHLPLGNWKRQSDDYVVLALNNKGSVEHLIKRERTEVFAHKSVFYCFLKGFGAKLLLEIAEL